MLPPDEDVLRRQQPLLDRRGDAALEHHRLARAAELAEQREVLHVARADLEDVGVLADHLDLAGVHHLGDELQVVRVRRLRAAAAGPPRPGPGSCRARSAA